MRLFAHVLISALAVAGNGCGETPASLIPAPSPHGGVMTRLPKNAGQVAIKTENLKGKARSKTANIVAYFYMNDGATPLPPASTDVVFRLDETGKSKIIQLARDAKEPNKFISNSEPFNAGVSGTIQAKIGDKEVSESFSSR